MFRKKEIGIMPALLLLGFLFLCPSLAFSASCRVPLQSLSWYEKVSRLADRSLLSRRFQRVGYRPPRRSFVLAARVLPGVGQPAFQYFSLNNTGFVYSPRKFWPASTVKIWAALRALMTLRTLGLDGSATLSMLDSYGWFQGSAYDLYKHMTNESYDRLLRVAGLKQVNQFADRARYGVPNLFLHRGYGGGGVRRSPTIRYQQAGRVGKIPRRYWGGTHRRCRRNCTTLLDIQEVIRRVVLHDELPLQERFPIRSKDARRWRQSMKHKYWKWIRPGAKEALGSHVKIYNKAGSVPGNHILDNALIDSMYGRFLLTVASPWPRRHASFAPSVRELNELVRQTLLGVRDALPSTPPLQPDFGINLQVRVLLATTRTHQVRVWVQAKGATHVRVWVGSTAVPMRRHKGSFQGRLSLARSTKAILVVQAFQHHKVVGYRVFGAKQNVLLPCP